MSEFNTGFWLRPQSHETRTHNIALESEIILIGILLRHETHHIRERNYYDWRVIRRDEV